MHHLSHKRGVTNAAVIVGALALAAVVIIAILRDRIVNAPWREVSVTGTGEVAYTPDRAVVLLGVHVDAASAQAALALLNAMANAVIPALTALGIPAEDIATHNYSLSPQYAYPDGQTPRVSGYSADQQLSVRVNIASSTDLIGRAIETASAHGVNQVLGVSFEPSNVDDLKQQALLLAIKDAKSRAQETATAAGVRLKKVIGWWENPIYVPGPGQPIPYGGYGMGGDATLMTDKGGMVPIVPPGTQKVIMQVNLNYSVR